MPTEVSLTIFICGLVQLASSSTLIVFYAINKYALVTKAGWRRFNKTNRTKFTLMDNEKRLNVRQMSFEQTHLILMLKGPQAEEFNIVKGKTDYGNRATYLEANLMDIFFFL